MVTQPSPREPSPLEPSPRRNGRRQVGAGFTSSQPGVSDAGALEQQILDGTATVKVHLDRVNLHVGAGDADRTYGALVDLFIATGPSASEVRSRALHWSRAIITAYHRDALAARLDRPVGSGVGLPSSPYSLLRRISLDAHGEQPASPMSRGSSTGSVTAPHAPLAKVDRFDPRETLLSPVIAAMETARTGSLAKRIEGTFGSVVVTPGSIAIRLAPRADLSQVRREQVTVSSARITAADLTGAFTPSIGLWNLALGVAAERLPQALDTAATYRLTRMPDLTRIDRVGPDARILSQLHLQSIRLGDLLASESAAARSVVAAAWVCGMLTEVSRPAPHGLAGNRPDSGRH
ncbi:hypothetical protein BH09ACT11_BH09ACT11_07570 [soil metagenome]